MEINQIDIIDQAWVEIANTLFYGIINQRYSKSPYSDTLAPTIDEWNNMVINRRRESRLAGENFKWMDEYINNPYLIYNGFNKMNLKLKSEVNPDPSFTQKVILSKSASTLPRPTTSTLARPTSSRPTSLRPTSLRPTTSTLARPTTQPSTSKILMSVSPVKQDKKFKAPQSLVRPTLTEESLRRIRRSKIPDETLRPDRQPRSRSMSPNISQTSSRVLLSKSPQRSPSNMSYSSLDYMYL